MCNKTQCQCQCQCQCQLDLKTAYFILLSVGNSLRLLNIQCNMPLASGPSAIAESFVTRATFSIAPYMLAHHPVSVCLSHAGIVLKRTATIRYDTIGEFNVDWKAEY